MFIDNKYQRFYTRLMCKARCSPLEENVKYHTHHIIPRSLGGTNDESNLVRLTYRQHRLAHLLLPKFTEGEAKHKMLYAAKLFGAKVYVPSPGFTKESRQMGVQTRKRKGSYKTGANNVFSSEAVKIVVRERMTSNNPMKKPSVVEKYKKNRPHSNHIKTPTHYFFSIREAARHYGLSDYDMKKVALSQPDIFTIITAKERYLFEAAFLPDPSTPV